MSCRSSGDQAGEALSYIAMAPCIPTNRNPDESVQLDAIYVDDMWMYLEPNWPLFWRSTFQNKALFNQNKGHLGSR